MFKRNKAITIDKMHILNDVVINEDNVKFNIQYSNTKLTPEQVPKLLSDVMQLYALVKPCLDKKSQETPETEVKPVTDLPDTPIDLSDIPF